MSFIDSFTDTESAEIEDPVAEMLRNFVPEPKDINARSEAGDDRVIADRRCPCTQMDMLRKWNKEGRYNDFDFSLREKQFAFFERGDYTLFSLIEVGFFENYFVEGTSSEFEADELLIAEKQATELGIAQ